MSDVFEFYRVDRKGKAHLCTESKKLDLPEEVEHGSARAARLGCQCDKCMERRSRMRRHGWRV